MSDTILYLAPILGVTDWIFRSAFSRVFGGFDVAVTPFIKTMAGGRYKQSKLADFLPQNNGALPIHPQILTNDPDDFLKMAEVLLELGHCTINLNLGCPMPTSTAKCKGAGMLPHTERIDSFLAKVTNQLPGLISIKTRTGLDNAGDLWRLVPVFNRHPLREIIIHPRTAKQRYAGDIDLITFEKCLTELTHEVIYNGEINSIEQFNQLRERFVRVNKWMIGRGALKDPLLPSLIKNTSDERNRGALSWDFHEELLENYTKHLAGDHAVIARMTSIWDYLSSSYCMPERTLKHMSKARSLGHYRQLCEAALSGKST